MAANSSSNDSVLHISLPYDMHCLFMRPSSIIFNAFNITSILLLLPLCIFILYLAFQRRQRQRSTLSHSDIFTYHMVAMELIRALGCAISCFGIFWDHTNTITAGYFLRAFTWIGQMFFHILTCVERYLAVVHPVSYMSLRGERGIRIRNISIGCVWLLCIGETSLITSEIYGNLDFCILILSLIVVLFCSLSVLYVLIRPGPGDQGGDRERVDQTKRRAFYTITAIVGVLSLRCFVSLIWSVAHVLRERRECLISAAVSWFNLPSSLVLPLLFLHRAGILACRKNNSQ